MIVVNSTRLKRYLLLVVNVLPNSPKIKRDVSNSISHRLIQQKGKSTVLQLSAVFGDL